LGQQNRKKRDDSIILPATAGKAENSMDNNDLYYHPQTPVYGYDLGLPEDDAANYPPTSPSPAMSRDGSNKSYHSSSSASSARYPQIHANPLPQDMSYHDNNAGYNEYSQSYSSEGLKREDDGWQATFVPDDSHVYYDYTSSEPIQQNYITSPPSMPLSTSPLEDMM